MNVRQKVADWEKGILPGSDYEFGLLHHHLEFLTRLSKDLTIPIKPSAAMSEETVQEWLGRLRDLSLTLSDAHPALQCWLEAKKISDEILELVKRPSTLTDKPETSLIPSQLKERSVFGKIVDEVKVWNRKKLSSHEYESLLTKLDKLKQVATQLDTKDPEWVQFLSRMEAYSWRQEARLKLENNSHILTDEEIREMLKRSPKEIVDSKGHEWTSLLQRSRKIEILTPKQIEERIQAFLGQNLSISDWEEVSNFLGNTKISSYSEDLTQKLEIFKKAANYKCFLDTIELEPLQSLLEEMLESKLWNTLTFSQFDLLVKTANEVREAAFKLRNEVQSESINTLNESSPLETYKQHLKELKQRKDKPFASKIKELLDQCNEMPAKVWESVKDDSKNLEQELAKVSSFKSSKKSMLSKLGVQICTQYEQSNWKSLVWQVCDIFNEYKGLSFRDDFMEEWLSVFDLLLTAIWGLHNQVFGLPVWESMVNDLKLVISTSEQDQTTSGFSGESLHQFPEFLDAISELCRKVEVPISKAKEFVKIVHQIKYATVEESQKMTLAEAQQLLSNHKQSQTPILMSESEEYLEEAISKLHSLEPLCAQDILDYSQLMQSIKLLENTGLKMDGEKSTYLKQKIQQADGFKSKIQSYSNQQLEELFESLAEEYTSLKIRTETVESLMNELQVAKDSLEQLRESESLFAELELSQLLQLRNKTKDLRFFRGRFQDSLAKLYQSIFTKIIEEIETRKPNQISPQSENSPSKLKFEEFKAMVDELRELISKSDKDSKPQQLYKLLSQLDFILKDASDFCMAKFQKLAQQAISTSKNVPCDTYKNFIDISSLMKEYENRRRGYSGMSMKQSGSAEENRHPKIYNNKEGFAAKTEGTRERSREHDKEVNGDPTGIKGAKGGEGNLLPSNSEDNLSFLSENRGYNVKKLRDVLWNNKVYSFQDSKDATNVAKTLETLAWNSNFISGTNYTKTIDDLVKSLRDVMSHPYIVSNLRQTKFSLDSIQAILGKNPSELKQLNLELKQRQLQGGTAVPPDSKFSKPLPKSSRISGLIDTLARRPVKAEERVESGANGGEVSEPAGKVGTETQSGKMEEEVLGRGDSSADKSAVPKDGKKAKPKGGPAMLMAGVEEYRHYRVFRGPIFLQEGDDVTISFPHVEWTCASASQAHLAKFCRLDDKKVFSTKVSQQAFDNYVRKSLQNGKKYSFVAGVVTPFGEEDTLKQKLLDKKCVASVQYTPACKAFLFPPAFFAHDWATHVELVLPIEKEVALIFMIVRKTVEVDESDPSEQPAPTIVPEIVIGERKLYKLRANNQKQPVKLVQQEPEAPQVVPHDTLQEIQQTVSTRENVFLESLKKGIQTQPPTQPPTILTVLHRNSHVLEVSTQPQKPARVVKQPAPQLSQPPQPVAQAVQQQKPSTPAPLSKSEMISSVLESFKSVFPGVAGDKGVRVAKEQRENRTIKDAPLPGPVKHSTPEIIEDTNNDNWGEGLSGQLQRITGKRSDRPEKGDRGERAERAEEKAKGRDIRAERDVNAGRVYAHDGWKKSGREQPAREEPTSAILMQNWQVPKQVKVSQSLTAQEVESSLLNVQKHYIPSGNFRALCEAARGQAEDVLGKDPKTPPRYNSQSVQSYGSVYSGSRGGSGTGLLEKSRLGEEGRRQGRAGLEDSGETGLLGKRGPSDRTEDYSAIKEAVKYASPLQLPLSEGAPYTDRPSFLQSALSNIQLTFGGHRS